MRIENKQDYLYSSSSGVSQIKPDNSFPSDGDVLDYYRQFCSKNPDISFRIDDRSNNSDSAVGYNGSFYESKQGFGNPSQMSMYIDISVLRKMYSDKSYEEYITNVEVSAMRRDWYRIKSEAGYNYKCYSLDDTSGTVSIKYSQSPFSTEEQLKDMHRSKTTSDNIMQMYIHVQNKIASQLLELGEVSQKQMYHSKKSGHEEYKRQEIILDE